MAQVRSKVEPITWDAFHLTAVEGLPSATVAQRLVMAVGNVYAARYQGPGSCSSRPLQELEGTSGSSAGSR